MDVFVKKATACMPLHRELFSDVVCKRSYGNISQVWHFPGHILVTTNDGRKLFTFDCVPVPLQQTFEPRCLDIASLPTPLLDCLMLSEDVIALIDKQGCTKLWKFSDSCEWQPWGELDLCQSNTTEVVSVAYVRSTCELVWCEKRQSPSSPSTSWSPSSTSLSAPPAPQFCVCRKQLPASFKSNTLPTLGPASILMHNSPCCEIKPISGDCLFISFMYDKDNVSVHMIFDFTADLVTLYVGDEFVTADIKDGVDFQEVALTCLSSLAKAEVGRGDCGVRADESESYAAVLSSSGALDIYSCFSSSNKRQLNKRHVHLSKCDLDLSTAGQTLWFLHRKVVGIVCGNIVSMYSTTDGSKLCATSFGEIIEAQAVVISRSPAFMAWILTDDQLYGVQGRDTSMNEMMSTPDKLPEDELLQTDILHLARLQQCKSEGYSLALSQELEKLKNKQSDLGGLHHQSEVAQILAPYVEEYWRLDSLSKALLDSDKRTLKPNTGSTPKTFVTTIMESRTISHSARHAKLLWLSQVYPRQLLDYLSEGVSFNDCLDQNQLHQWKRLIGLDGGDLLHFEFVCRLLFHLEPGRLIPFVKCAEAVSEQSVGVSAFVRKKQSLVYYKAACECLPECQTSRDPKVAASSKAKLIRESGCDNCEELSLKCYLHHGLWDEALQLLREVDQAEKSGAGRCKEGNSQLPTLLHVTVTSLAQNQVVSDYVSDLFALMPDWKSFLSFSKVATALPEIRHQQLATSAQDVFVEEEQRGVALGSVRSHLLDLIKEINSK